MPFRLVPPLLRRSGVLPDEAAGNVSAAIYGLILSSSIIVASGADHPGQPGLVEIYLCVTAVVFYLAHVYSRVIGAWMEGRAPDAGSIRDELRREWPMLGVQLLPILLLLLGVLHLLGGRAAITLATAFALGELMLSVVVACRRVEATRRQAAASITVALLFAAIVVALKVLAHH